MRNTILSLPPQKPISELNPPRNWAYFPMDEGVADSASTAISNDSRATSLADAEISGTVGTFWSDRPGYAVPNGTASPQIFLSAEPNLADVCEFGGNTLLIGFSCLFGHQTVATEYVMFLGGSDGADSSGLQIRRTSGAPDRLSAIFYDDTTNSLVTSTTTNWGSKYTITEITTGTTPTVTTLSVHRLRPGDYVALSATDSTPAVDGIYQVVTVPSTNTFTIATANITVAATSGYVSPEGYAFLVIDGVSQTAQWHMTQKGASFIDSSNVADLSVITASFDGSVGNKNLTFFDRRQQDYGMTSGHFRRFLFQNYGAQTVANALPTLTTKLIPALRNSDMVPVWELED